MTETSALFFVTEGGGAPEDNTFDKVLITLSGSAGQDGTISIQSQNTVQVTYSPDALIAVPAEGVYFISDYVEDSGDVGEAETSEVFEEHFGSTLTYTNALNSIDQSGMFGTVSGGNPIYGSDTIDNFAIDTAHNILYFVDGEHFIEDSFSSADFGGTPTKTTLATLPGPAQEIALDLANHTAYFTGHSGSESLISNAMTSLGVTHNVYTGTYTGNYIYKVSGVTTSATAGALTADATIIAVPFTDGLVEGIASYNGTLYFTTEPSTVGVDVSGDFGIFDIPEGATSAAQIGTVWEAADSSALASGHIAQMSQITIDPESGEYYVSTQLGTIYAGNVTSSATPTLVVNANTISGLTSDSTMGPVVEPEGLFVDPAGTASGISVAAINGNAGITSGEIGAGDTITIAVTFSTAETVTATPSLTLNDGGTASYTSGSGSDVLDFVYKPQSGQNVKTLGVTAINGTFEDGADVAAVTAGDTATFSGVTVDTTPPVLNLSGTSTEFVQSGGSAAVLASATISDPDGNGTLSAAAVTITNYKAGDVLNIGGVTNGTTLGLNFSVTGGTLTLSGTEPDASYVSALELVTFKDTGTDGSTGAHPTRTLDWSVTESIVGGSLVGSATTTITIDRPPSLASGGYTAAVTENSQTSGGAGAALAGDTDADGDGRTITSFSGSGGTVAAGSALSGLYGSLTLNADGSYTYDASNTTAIDAASGGASPVDQFTFTVADGKGGTATEGFDVTIHRPPTLSGGDTVTFHAGYPLDVDSGLVLNAPDTEAGNLISGASVVIGTGFLAGDTLTAVTTGLPGINAAYNQATGVLTLSGNDTPADYQAVLRSVTFSSSAADPTDGGADTQRVLDYQVADQGGHASNILTSTVDVTDAPCFAAGTRILTASGALVPVEDLREGDAVETYNGEAARIIWIGRRAIAPRRHPRPESVQPILVTAGALGNGLPWRDLVVSPDHALFLEGFLIPAKVLTNGFSVRQLNRATVTYYHIELPQHAVLFAEGVGAESYLETGNRAAFENGGGALTLHPDFAQALREQRGCAPFAESGNAVETVRQRILDRARIETTSDPDLQIRYENGGAIITCRNAIPGEIFADPRDRRRLGVKIAGLQVDGRNIALDDPALTVGWHHPEPDGRWTNGRAEIPTHLLGGSKNLQVSLAAALQYPLSKMDGVRRLKQAGQPV